MAFNFLAIGNSSPKLAKIFINLWAPYLGAGIKINKMATDYKFIEVGLKQRWYNTNLVGTHFGGSIYAMVDPFYMFMLIKNLGDKYIVWDKAAEINFINPGKGKLTTTFTYTDQEIQCENDTRIISQQIPVSFYLKMN